MEHTYGLCNKADGEYPTHIPNILVIMLKYKTGTANFITPRSNMEICWQKIEIPNEELEEKKENAHELLSNTNMKQKQRR